MSNESLTSLLTTGSAFSRMDEHGQAALEATLSPRLDHFRQGLDELAVALDQPTPTFSPRSAIAHSTYAPMRLSPDLRERAEALYLRLWDRSGASKRAIEEGLLTALGFTADPASLPFWSQIIGLSRPRDSFAGRRRVLALAGLAHTALHCPKSAAHDALVGLTAHPLPDVRGRAIEALVAVSMDEEQNRDPSLAPLLHRIATEDRAFAPRFLARGYLLAIDELPPLFKPDEVLAFEVTFGRASRTIELRAKQTLDDLHHAIQGAFEWDADHLYAFYLTGERDDPRFTLPNQEDDGAADIPLGALGFPTGHRFTYRFDFGDSNLFNVLVVGSSTAVRRAKYPRVIATKGKSPPQYRDW
ncbi:MAG: hypothetical protein ABJE95_24135 [Byssovorax sp.]